MFYEALFAIGIRNNPDPKDPIVARMEHGEIGRSLETSPDGAFVKLLILSDFARPIQGWAKFKGEVGDLLQQVEAPPILDFSLWAFLKACVDAERRFNDPGDNKTSDDKTRFFITADFLIAWADIEFEDQEYRLEESAERWRWSVSALDRELATIFIFTFCCWLYSR